MSQESKIRVNVEGDLVSADRIYDFQTNEEEYYNRLKGWKNKLDFGQFVPGYNLLHGPPLNTPGSNNDNDYVIDEWVKLGQERKNEERNEHMQRAINNPDPRPPPAYPFRLPPCLPQKLRVEDPEQRNKVENLTPFLEDYILELDQGQRENFKDFVLGMKFLRPTLRKDGVDEFLPIYFHGTYPKTVVRAIRAGKAYRQANFSAETESASNHDYVHHVASRELPSPTQADRTHINKNLQRLSMPGHWVFLKTLYQNANGTFRRIVHLLVRLDEHDNIERRVVAKIQGFDSLYALQKELRKEFGLHHAVSNKGCRHILDAYGSSTRQRPDSPHLSYIYMDYAPFGDLVTLLRAIPQNTSQIPEPFIWIVFRGMAEALHVNFTGQMVSSTHPLPGTEHYTNDQIRPPEWRPITNTDIKTRNIVLGDGKKKHSAYKTPKMIDFGLAFRGKREFSILDKKLGIGTKGCRPPEMQYVPGGMFNSAEVNIQSDVFNVGLVIMGLMEGRGYRYEDPTQDAKHTEDYSGFYSHALESLVQSCVSLDPSNRPALYKILYETRVGLEKWEKVYGPVSDKTVDEIPDFARVDFKQEEFRVGEEAPESVVRQVKKRKSGETAQDEQLSPRQSRRKSSENVAPATPKGRPARLRLKLKPRTKTTVSASTREPSGSGPLQDEEEEELPSAESPRTKRSQYAGKTAASSTSSSQEKT
ncbi:kinase-like domain-containing protein [Massariosphaeria phaeospora]|uniref:non-specific serine/threonine protein kinase n=1 Tax=Massariosphaeria phaeospora TaxID=100035 RepID=A0A7C8IBC7_9PLEO|nr:kinase-like domain-containing protein [Massariosphaeria phaeospora]